MRDLTDSISVEIVYDRALWRRAMTGWWQSVVPPAPFARRAFFWAGVWLAIAVFAGALGLAGLSPMLVLWGLVGAGFMVGVFGFLQRTRMGRFWDEIGRHWERAGVTRAIFDGQGISLSDDIGERRLDWSGVDAIRAVSGGTVIRSGISMIVVPDDALDMPAADFRSKLAGWRSVA